MTEYVVLEEQDDGAWRESSIAFEARSSRAAIQHHLGSDPMSEGKWVAVPARSWKPVTVKVGTKTALRFS